MALANPITWLQAASRIASALERLAAAADRYVPPPDTSPDPHSGEPAVGETREEWEVAVAEEVEARRAATDREIK